MSEEKISTQLVVFPEGVEASIDTDTSTLSVKGEKGTLTRSFTHPIIELKKTDEGIEFSSKNCGLQSKKLLKTYAAHVKNMCKGVSEGHDYELKICSGHFPMNVSLKGNVLEIKNFIGEVVPRKVAIKEGVTVKVNGDKIHLNGIDKELVSQTAATIEKATRRNGFDRRNFQDGIYIISKDGKSF
ncbi:MAG: 50S ribosomal protein L6 [Candidatus Nanoarchaeia archaeon]